MKKIRNTISVLLIIGVLCCSLSSVSLAQSSEELTLEDAKAYLLAYESCEKNSYGKDVIMSFDFKDEEHLDQVAHFITEQGIDYFEYLLDMKLEEYSEGEVSAGNMTRAATPYSATRYIKKLNKTHTVSAYVNGVADFNDLGTAEYQFYLSYSILVKDLKMDSVTSYSFRNISMSSGTYEGDSTYWGNSDTGASVTVNFTMSKSADLPIGDISIPIKTRTTTDWFALYTYFE